MCADKVQDAAERTPRFWRGITSGRERLQWWRARRQTAVYVPFSVYTMAWLVEHRAFIVKEFIKTGGSPVATQLAFRIRFALGRREAVPDKKTIYRWESNFRQTGQTLEALKEAIRQEVAAITPETILKVMDNYRERLHQFINIQGRQLSDILFKTHRYKTAFCVLSRNGKIFAVSPLILNIFASQIGEFFLPHSV